MKRLGVMLWVAAAFCGVVSAGASAAEIEDRRRELASVLEVLSTGDRSMLLQGLKSTKSELMTDSGSANYLLWSKLAEWGYMRDVSETGRMAGSLAAMGVKLKRFSVTKAGQVAIPKLLE